MMKINKIEILFFIVLALFAIFITQGKTIAWGLLPLVFLLNSRNESSSNLNLKLNHSFFILVVTVFLTNFLVVYNFNTNSINLPHPDFHFYLKVAKNFTENGIENNLTARNVIFKELNFASPYRFFDTWMLSFLLFILPFSDLQTLQLIFIPILFSVVVLSVYKNSAVKSIYIKLILSFLFLFLFGDIISSKFMFNSFNSEVCVVSYPKLAIFFCVFLYFIKSQLDKVFNAKSILYLALLPILIQTSFPIYIFIVLYLIYNFREYKKNLKIPIAIFISMTYYITFYFLNFIESKKFFTFGQFQYAKSVNEYFSRIVSITFDLIFAKSIIFIPILILLFIIASKVRRIVYFKITVMVATIFLSGILIFAFLPSSPNSYQFLTNFIYPLLIVLVYLFSIDVINNIKTLNKKNIGYGLLIVAGSFGFINQSISYGFFNTKDNFSKKYDKQFLNKTKISFNTITKPIGLTYWSKNNNKRNTSEYFDQYGTGFLIYFSAKYDVVCLSALNIEDKNFADKLYKHNSAISIYERLNPLISKNKLEENFYNSYPFEFLISDLKQSDLPKFIEKNIFESIFDKKNKIYFYKLKREIN